MTERGRAIIIVAAVLLFSILLLALKFQKKVL